jgi:regulator of sigma E protease
VIIDYVEPNTPAAEAGLQANDRVVAVNGINLRNTRQLQKAVQESKGNPLQLTVERNNQ